MLELIDGPCQGIYMCHRAPVFLRAVINTDGESDCLDQLEDKPAEDEIVYVYEQISNDGTIHLYGPKISGWYPIAKYRFLPDINGQELRGKNKWQDWATKRLR